MALSPKVRAMLEAVWKKALREGQVEMKFDNKSMLTRARFKLYEVANLIRKDEKLDDFDLRKAVEDCMITVPNETTLLVIKKDMDELMAVISEQSGIPIEQAMAESPEALAIEESMRKLQEKLVAGDVSTTIPVHVPNKYYDRS